MKRSGHPGLRYTASVIGAVFWTTLILSLYYWVHKPLTPPLARAVGGAILDIIIALLFTIIGGGLGRRVLRQVDLTAWGTPERIAAAGLIGLPVLSLLILVTGIVLLNTVSVAILLSAIVGLTRRDLFAWLGEWSGLVRCGFPSDRWERFLAFIVLIMLLMALLIGLLPPTKWDVLTYHLAGPQQYVEHGRFFAAEHNHFLGFPQLVETLYAGQLALTGRLMGSGLLHWVIGSLTLLFAGGYAARRSGAAAGWMAVGTLLAATTIWMEMSFAYVDLLPVGLLVMGIAVLDQWSTIPPPQTARFDRSYVILLGIIAGLSLGTKYTALWLVAALGVLVLWAAWQRGGLRTALIAGGVFGTMALLIFMPWLLRNFIWYDNPVYPFVFDAAEMDSIRQDWYSQPESGLIYGNTAWQIPILPITATFLGKEGEGSYNTDIGPLFLILTPLSLLVWRRFSDEERRTAGFVLGAAGILTVGWVLSATFGSYISLQTRLVLYMFGPLAVVAGMTLEALRRLPKKPLDVSFVVRAMVALILVFTVISGVRFFIGHGAQHYFSGEDDYRDAYLLDRLGWHYESMRQINQLPADSTVRFLWEPRYLYCDNERLNCHTDSLMDAWYYARRTLGNTAAIATQWQADGADYLLAYEFGRGFEQDNAGLYEAEDWTAWREFVTEYLEIVWWNGTGEDDIQYILYSWRE